MLAGEGRQSSTATTSSDEDIPLLGRGPHPERWDSAPMIPLPPNGYRRPTRLDVRNSSYTSLRDIVVTSPTFNVPDANLNFRNRLLTHAAYAYLQPRESPTFLGNRSCYFGRRWPEDHPPTGCVGWVCDICSCAYDLCSHAFSCLFSMVHKGWMREGDDVDPETTEIRRRSSFCPRSHDD